MRKIWRVAGRRNTSKYKRVCDVGGHRRNRRWGVRSGGVVNKKKRRNIWCPGWGPWGWGGWGGGGKIKEKKKKRWAHKIRGGYLGVAGSACGSGGGGGGGGGGEKKRKKERKEKKEEKKKTK